MDVDVRLLREQLERRVDLLAVDLGAVDVERPVREREGARDLLRGPVEPPGGSRGAGRARRRGARGRRRLRGPAARGQQPGEAQPGGAHPGRAQEPPAGHARMQHPSQQREIGFVVIRHRALLPSTAAPRHSAHRRKDRRPPPPASIGCRLPSTGPSRKGRMTDPRRARARRRPRHPSHARRAGRLRLFVRWRNEPHVAEWWNTDDDPVADDARARRAEYGPGADAWVTRCIISIADRPVGYVQFYPWAAELDEAREMGVPDPDASFGLDIFIGEPDMVGRGVGARRRGAGRRGTCSRRRAPRQRCAAHARRQRPRTPAYEKAGFRKVRQTLDTDVVDGERRMSWLMVLDRPLG